MDAAALTSVAAWVGAVAGTAGLAVGLLALRVASRRPRLAVAFSSASHARRGRASALACTLDVRNEGDAPARVHVVEAHVEALTTGAAGLRPGRATARAAVDVVLAPGAVDRRRVEFSFPDALLPDGDVAVRLRVVHERGAAEARGASRGA